MRCAKCVRAAAAVSVLLGAGPVRAAVIHVPADQGAIQAAIDVAVHGDEIVVAPGVYLECIDLLGKVITVRAENPAAELPDPADPATASIIDGSACGSSVVTCASFETGGTHLDGFTIRNGVGTEREGGWFGGGMLIDGTSPTVERCVFLENDVSQLCPDWIVPCGRGGGMAILGGAAPVVSACVFESNTADDAGGGVYSFQSDPQFANCTFHGNDGGHRGGAVECIGSGVVLAACELEANVADTGAAVRVGRYGAGAGQLEVIGCVFDGNEAAQDGGAIHVDESCVVTVTGSGFSANSAGWFGGAVCTLGGAASFTGSTFQANSAGFGGGAAYGPLAAALTLTGSTLAGSAPTHVSGGWTDGGGNGFGPLCDPSSGSPLLVPVEYGTIQAAVAAACDGAVILVAPGTYTGMVNLAGKEIRILAVERPDATTLVGPEGGPVVVSANYEGPASVLDGFTIQGGRSGMYVAFSSPTVHGCLFHANTATLGGGIRNVGGSPWVERCVFSGNHTESYGPYPNGGAGMYNEGGAPTIVSCVFAGNAAGTYGRGGAICNIGASPTILACTFYGNTAGWSGAGMFSDPASSPLVANCIFWANPGMEIAGPASVRYSDVEGGYPGVGNIDADPLWVDPAGGDFRLGHGSPCIDAGDNMMMPDDACKEILGAPRFVCGGGALAVGVPDGVRPLVDLGACEVQRTCMSDLDCGGAVGFGDLLNLLGAWGDCWADLDDDGMVGWSDLQRLIEDWGACP